MITEKRQRKIALFLIVIAFIIGVYLFNRNYILCINLMLGFCFGEVMSRTNFSFTNNLKGPVLNNDYSTTKMLVILSAITSVGVNIIVYTDISNGVFDIHSYVGELTKISAYFFIAAIVFGFGCAICGMAGSGLIRRCANAKFDYILATSFYVVGSVCGVIVRDYALLYFDEFALFMPDLFGWPLAILIHCLLLGIAYFIANRGGFHVKKSKEVV